MARNLKLLNEDLHRYGITVDTYSPGDGVTRYRFFSETDRAYARLYADDPATVGYFSGDGIYTALGWKDCQTFAAGFRAGSIHAHASVGLVV